jgi:anti-sigma factor RsiW
MFDSRHIDEELPWYVNGTLAPQARAAVERHVEACERCRSALELERRIASSVRTPGGSVALAPHRGWQALAERIDAEEAALPPAPARAASEPRAGRRHLRRIALPLAIAAQGLTIVVLALLLWRERSVPPAVFRTLSDADATLQVGAPLIRVAFDASVGEARARAIAASLEARIVAGPSRENVYTLAVGRESTGSAETVPGTAVAALRRMPEVLLAEPIAIAPADPTASRPPP